jgi:hypothetical protein
MQKIIRLGITDIAISKPPFLEWQGMNWRVWTTYNTDLSSGVFVELFPDGTMQRNTLQNGVLMDITQIN